MRSNAALDLYRACFRAACARDLPGSLELASNPHLTTGMLAALAPGWQERDADAQLVRLILDHPACSAGIASRYLRHHETEIRLRVVAFPGMTRADLLILAHDSDPDVAAAARTALTAAS